MHVNPKSLRLYAVTDRAWTDGTEGLLRQVADAIDGGATMVQLREKHLSRELLRAEALEIQALCRTYGVPFLINDDVDLALEIGADGVHVGQEDLAAGRAREALGPDKIIGVSAHNADEALAAQAAGADYLGVGAAFVTGTKADAKPVTRETLRAVTAAVEIPAVAIGGITRENLLQLKGCGLQGVAGGSPPFGHPGVKGAGGGVAAPLGGEGGK